VAIATGDLNADGDGPCSREPGRHTSRSCWEAATWTARLTRPGILRCQPPTTPAGIVIANFANGAVPDLADEQGFNTLGIYLGLGKGTFASRIELNTSRGACRTHRVHIDDQRTSRRRFGVQDPAATQGVVTVIQDSSQFLQQPRAGVAQTPYPASEYVDLGGEIKATPTLHPITK